MTLRRITRDRRLSQDEATKYREVRARVEEELPELIGRHHERLATFEELEGRMPERSQSHPYKIHAVVFTEGPWCVAQCLEYDIATRARSMSELYSEIERIIAAHIVLAQQEGQEPFANIPQAPKRFWQMYKDANLKVRPIRAEASVVPAPVSVEVRAV